MSTAEYSRKLEELDRLIGAAVPDTLRIPPLLEPWLASA